MRSLASRLLALWAMSLLACAAVALLLVQLYAQSTAAQVQRGEAVVAGACGLIRDRYSFYVAGWRGGPPDAELRAGLAAAVALALRGQAGVEGGVWQGEESLAYAFPTYEGLGPKTDLPAAEAARILAANRDAAREEQAVSRRVAAGTQTLLLAACPLPGPLDGATAWAMLRVRAVAGLGSLQAGLGVLLALVAGMSLWLARLALGWRGSLRAMERALRMHQDPRPDPRQDSRQDSRQDAHQDARQDARQDWALPALRPTGERELDRVVSALNEAGRRLAEARAESEALAARVAASDRLAALGRVAAGVAHEVRNPLAAMRIRAESARHGDDERRRRAIEVILEQVARLDRLVSSLLAMTQRPEPRPRAVALAALLEEVAAEHRARAEEAGVALRVEALRVEALRVEAGRVEAGRVEAGGHAMLDPELLGRALGNLVLNAVQHTPRGGTVTLSALREGDGRVRLVVADTGPGVAPGLRATLFEPFVTGRAGGTGLGLAIARELVDAMGGRLSLLGDAGDAGAWTPVEAGAQAGMRAGQDAGAELGQDAGAGARAGQDERAGREVQAGQDVRAGAGLGGKAAGARFLVDLPGGGSSWRGC